MKRKIVIMAQAIAPMSNSRFLRADVPYIRFVPLNECKIYLPTISKNTKLCGTFLRNILFLILELTYRLSDAPFLLLHIAEDDSRRQGLVVEETHVQTRRRLIGEFTLLFRRYRKLCYLDRAPWHHEIIQKSS